MKKLFTLFFSAIILVITSNAAAEERAWLGVTLQDVTEELAKQFGLAKAQGVLVVDLAEDGPAEKAGIKRGDIILEFNKSTVITAFDIRGKVFASRPGDTVLMIIWRDAKPFFISIKLGTMPAELAKQIEKPSPPIPEKPIPKSDVRDLPLDEKLPSPRSDTYAIVIGIDYKGRQDIPNLQYASQDAKKIYSILTDVRYGGVPKENTVLLLNEKATRNTMVAALRKIKTWDGYVYVYYSGHGAPKTKGDKFIDAFLVPNDVVITDPEAMEDTSIKMSYLQELVDTSNAKGVMLALDACFSGGGKSIVPKGGKPLVGIMVTPEIMKPKGTGKVIITSSATNEQSWEDEKELKSGIFSHYLLEGLKGKASKDVWVKSR